MKRIILIILVLAAICGHSLAIDGPWNPNEYSGTFRGYGDFLPGRAGYNLGSALSPWAKLYVDSIIGAALVGYADSSHRADSLLFQGSYISLSKYLYTNYNDTNLFFGLGCGNSSVSRYSNGFGYGALGSAGTLTLFSNAFGFEALKNIGGVSANGNHGFGHKVLTTLTAGVDNDGFGLNTMRDLQVGNNNSGFGDQALMLMTTGDQNSGFGQSVMLNADSCYKNAGFGVEALYNTIGTGNIGFGYQALYNNFRSNYRIGIGYQVDAAVWPDTLRQDTTIAIGFKASSDSQGIAIGDSAVAMLKNSGALGNHVTSRIQNYFTILNIDNDTIRVSKTLFANSIVPLITGTGSVGASGNAFNIIRADSFNVGDSLFGYLSTGNKRIVDIDTLRLRRTDGGYSTIYTVVASNAIYYVANNHYFGVAGANPIYAGTGKFGQITTGVVKNNYLYVSGSQDNPVMIVSDSSAGVARSTDSLFYSSNSFTLSDSLKVDNILPKTDGTGSVGASGNAFNRVYSDSFSLDDSLLAWITAGSKRNLVVDSIYNGVIFGGPDKTYDITFNSGSMFNILQNGNLTWAGATAARLINYANINKIALTEAGASVVSDTISGYNGNTLTINSWGITITGVDTLYKLYGTMGDSFKVVSISGKTSTPSSGGDPDTIVIKNAVGGTAIKIPWTVGAKWLPPTSVELKYGKNDTCFVIFRKGATTAISNFYLSLNYGMCKGRVF